MLLSVRNLHTHHYTPVTNAVSCQDLKTKLGIATELRDNIDTWCQHGYTAFLAKLIPVFLHVLEGTPSFISNSPEQVRE